MPLILGANSVSGYTVKNSLRFNAGSSDYLNRTPSSTTNQQIFTYSLWLKRSSLSNTQTFFCGQGGTTDALRFGSDFTLEFYASNAAGAYLWTTQLFRDVSAWYHIVISVDTTQATSSNRIKIYINGSQVTSFQTATYPTQNYNFPNINTTASAFKIGRDTTNSLQYDGYMSDIFFIDGQALTPTSFGETDTLSGIWIPKSYSGSYGTNGFFLKFANSASLGTDSSGNGNTFTVNNLTSIDQTTDTPTNNFCTLNPLDNGNSNILTTNGNVSVSSSTTWDRGIKATFGVSSGKWYWEYKHGTVNSGTNPAADLGITKYSSLINSSANGGATNSETYFISGGDGSKYNGSYTPTSYGSAFTTGDIAIIALDMDNGKFYMGKNGTWFNSGNPATSTNPAYTSLSGTFLPVWYWGIAAGTSGVLISDFNFGNPPYSANSYTDGAGYGNFSYAVPSGYYSLNTKNLADYG